MYQILVFIFLFIYYSSHTFSQTINLGTTNVEASVLYTTQDVPWELKYGPGDSLWMTVREGRVYRIHPVTGGATLLLDHSSRTWTSGEAGMLGMTFHPLFSTNPFVYIAYTYLTASNQPRERLSRFTYSSNTLINELILIDGIIANTTHDGSRLVILNDNTLLMTTGDAQDQPAAQNVNSLNGKVLRVNLDGTIPLNNPNSGSLMFTSGHRNGQGLALHPNGKVYATEHGPNSNDEFHIIEAGRNYGWPNVYGFCDNDAFPETAFCTANNVKQPLASWNVVPPGDTWAPSDLIWYNHPSIPEFQNSFLISYLKTQKVNRVIINVSGDAIISQTDFFQNRWGRLRDIASGPDGQIYLATNSSPYRIIRIRNPLNPTPALITNYAIECVEGRFVITWQTQSELNNKQFNLYSSSNGIDFQLAAVIPTKAVGGTSNVGLSYSFTDIQPLALQTFYRLESEDIFGRKDLSPVQNATCDGKVYFKLTPNPSLYNTELRWTGVPLELRIKVFTSTGSLIHETSSVSPVTLPSLRWADGLYLVSAYDKNKRVRFKGKLLVR